MLDQSAANRCSYRWDQEYKLRGKKHQVAYACKNTSMLHKMFVTCYVVDSVTVEHLTAKPVMFSFESQ